MAVTGYKMTSCCNAYSTYDEHGILYCKKCFEEVPVGEGDGTVELHDWDALPAPDPAPVEPSVKERVRRFRAKLGKSNICDFQELRELLQDVYNELDDLDNADQELQEWVAALDADEEYIAACSGGQRIDDNPF